MKGDDEILRSLIVEGLVGATLGALVSQNTNRGETIGALAGAVLLATFRANQNARKANLPLYLAQDGTVYEINPDGETRFVKEIEQSHRQIPKRFQLT